MTAMEHAEILLGVSAMRVQVATFVRYADDDALLVYLERAGADLADAAGRADELCPDPDHDTMPAPVVVFAGPDDDEDEEDDTDIFDLGGEGVVEVGGVRFGTDAA